MKKLLLGIDGGGTSTKAIVSDLDGNVIGSGRGGVCNYQHAGVSGVLQAIEDSLIDALGRGVEPSEEYTIAAAFLGLAGITSKLDKSVIRGASNQSKLLKDAVVEVNHDIHIALSGGLNGFPGIALVAGTGSSCYGINENGVTHQCGGWGELADDFGSASWLGQRAIQIAVRQADGRYDRTELMAVVFDFLGISEVSEILNRIHTQQLTRDERAKLAIQLDPLYKSGDKYVVQLYTDAIESLAEMVFTVGTSLEMKEPRVVLSGGLATSKAIFHHLLLERIGREPGGFQVVEPVHSAELGALIEAGKLLGVVGETFRKTLQS